MNKTLGQGKSALVLGGSGFLGSHVSDSLSDHGFSVTIFDVRESKFKKPDQKFIKSSVLDFEAVKSAVASCDLVYNFAGLADLNQSVHNPLQTLNLNIQGNCNVLEAVRLADAEDAKKGTPRKRRFMFASTVYVYSDKGSFYGVSKKACEKIIEEYHRQFGLEYTIIRYGSVYGTRSDPQNRIYRIIRQALTENKITFQGDGTEEREYIHVRDAAKLSIELLDPKYANEQMILTGIERFKYSELLTIIKEMLGNKIEIRFLNEDYKGHYLLTPYSFSPSVGRKITNNPHIDFGQGLLEIITELHQELHS